MDAKLRARFNTELPQVYNRVLAEALLLIRRSRWRSGTKKTIQEQAQDLVEEAVFRTLDNKRIWDPSRVPDLHYFLKEVMRSIISAESTSRGSQTISLDAIEGGIENLAAASTGSYFRTPEENVADQEVFHQQLNQVFAAIGDDPLMTRIVEAVMNGCEKAAEIAEDAELRVEQVYEGMRKLRRRSVARKKAQP